ncbi:unnamed protein product [Lampetra fluviatilis]
MELRRTANGSSSISLRAVWHGRGHTLIGSIGRAAGKGFAARLLDGIRCLCRCWFDISSSNGTTTGKLRSGIAGSNSCLGREEER